MVDDKPSTPHASPGHPRLPARARLPINRCNLPADILGSLTFQRHPVALAIDGVAQLHGDLFAKLAPAHVPPVRAQIFADYMTVHFRLDRLEEAGFHPGRHRARADYLHMLRGWLFDSDGREAAALKGWVESRFGLLPRHHRSSLHDAHSAAWQIYLAQRAAGLYSTNAVESQLDLLYTYCQYELVRQHPDSETLRLYRGINRPDEYETIAEGNAGQRVVLLNNLNSFTSSRERADEFGDAILEADVPRVKIFYYSNLLPGHLSGEDEHLVIGGLYEVRLRP